MVNLDPAIRTREVTPRYIKGIGEFDGVEFQYAIPRGSTLLDRPLRILLSQHGTRDLAGDIGGPEYLSYPVKEDDPHIYDLIVIAPNFPSREEVGPDQLNGHNFEKFNGPGLSWIHSLVNDFLPSFLGHVMHVTFSDRRPVDSKKFYFFGHSRGGQAVHMYLMKYGNADIHRAAACGCELFEQGQYAPVPSNYLDRLDSLIQTDVASIIGTADIAKRGRPARRIESIRRFITQEVGQRIPFAELCRLLPAPPVPLPHLEAKIAFEDFPERKVERRDPLIEDVKFTFWWNANGKHLGSHNYPRARLYLYECREPKPIPAVRRAVTRFGRLTPTSKLRDRLELAELEDDDLHDGSEA